MMVRGGDQLPFEAFRYAHVGSLAYFGFCSAHLAPDPLGFADVYALAPIHCQLHNQTLQVAARSFCLACFQLGKPQTLALWINLRMFLPWNFQSLWFAKQVTVLSVSLVLWGCLDNFRNPFLWKRCCEISSWFACRPGAAQILCD